MEKRIAILGSTGSIGTQTLEVVDVIPNVKVVALTANSNAELLITQAKKYKPEKIAIMDETAYKILKNDASLKKIGNIDILFGMEGLIEIATMDSANYIVNALVGNIGLLPTIKAIEHKKHIGLANKETLVTAGELIMKLAKENNINIYPIDSEHSAIYQCLQSDNDIDKIYLTASGGPFRTYTMDQLQSVTIKDALNHPNWTMGAKITIDSATMMNKGLEVIEAKWLFDLEQTQISILVHPQSIIHSMVQYKDGAVIAQMGTPDMRLPISYALTHPKRATLPFGTIDFLKYNNLTFEQPQFDKFPCLGFAYNALDMGGTVCAALNAANEQCVSYFLNGKISFLDIPMLIERTLEAYTFNDISIENILKTDSWAREFVEKNVR